jgi:hypothetical protein
VDLRFDDELFFAERLRHQLSFFRRAGDIARRRRDAEFSEKFACLVFVDVQ